MWGIAYTLGLGIVSQSIVIASTIQAKDDIKNSVNQVNEYQSESGAFQDYPQTKVEFGAGHYMLWVSVFLTGIGLVATLRMISKSSTSYSKLSDYII